MRPAFHSAFAGEVGGAGRNPPLSGSISRSVRPVPVSNGTGVPSGAGAIAARPCAISVMPGATSNCSTTLAEAFGAGS